MSEFLFEPGSHLRALADAAPVPMFVVDEDVRILHANAAALAFLDAPLPSVLRDRCGRAIQCIHERESQEECGQTPHCDQCSIRQAVRHVIETEQAVRRPCEVVVQRDDGPHTVTFGLSATPFEYGGELLVVLALENLAALPAAQSP